jgi:hypothetical protein
MGRMGLILRAGRSMAENLVASKNGQGISTKGNFVKSKGAFPSETWE